MTICETVWPQHVWWTKRLLLACATQDAAIAERVAHEIGDCAHCWQTVASHAVTEAVNGWGQSGYDEYIALCVDALIYPFERLDEERET